jgi:hypothetical protein
MGVLTASALVAATSGVVIPLSAAPEALDGHVQVTPTCSGCAALDLPTRSSPCADPLRSLATDRARRARSRTRPLYRTLTSERMHRRRFGPRRLLVLRRDRRPRSGRHRAANFRQTICFRTEDRATIERIVFCSAPSTSQGSPKTSAARRRRGTAVPRAAPAPGFRCNDNTLSPRISSASSARTTPSRCSRSAATPTTTCSRCRPCSSTRRTHKRGRGRP